MKIILKLEILVDVLSLESTGLNFYVVKQTDVLSDDVDDGLLHGVIEDCIAKTSKGIIGEWAWARAGAIAGCEHEV